MIKVLIADDSAQVRQRLVAQIARIPGVISTCQAETTSATIDAIRRFKPDVVILDVHMPGGGGIEVLKFERLGKDTNQEGVEPIYLVISTYDLSQYREVSDRYGAHFFYHKSSEFTQIVDKVRQLAGFTGS